MRGHDGHGRRLSMCGMTVGGGPQDQPAQNQTTTTRSRLENLQRRLDELERGEISPDDVQEQRQGMCPMCRGSVGDSSDKRELEQRIQKQIQELEQQVSALEQGGRR